MTQVDEPLTGLNMSGLLDDSTKSDRFEGDRHRLAELVREKVADTRRYLLAFRFALFNLAAFALLGAAHLQGWLTIVLEADTTGLSVAIAAVFLGGFMICTRKIWRISVELNTVRNFVPRPGSWAARYLAEVAGREAGSRAITASALRVRLANRIAVVRHIANSLVLLGLIGTVIGFVIALSGVDAETVGDVRNITPMVTDLLSGMSVALYTTRVGAVLNLWLTVNYHILTGGTVKLLGGLIALGEAHARHRPV